MLGVHSVASRTPSTYSSCCLLVQLPFHSNFSHCLHTPRRKEKATLHTSATPMYFHAHNALSLWCH